MALGGFDCANCGCQQGEEWLLHYGDMQIRTETCPAQLVEPEFTGLVNLYGFYRDGVLAYAGGIMDQPAFYLEAMQIIAGIVAERDERNREG